ncbi:hypothetical protein U27_01170 [Candidatus Vecturithrix granuli]|uniref:Uncharacterized protein n=1 Tax=Vecturithrix granuli TaxID=1499967 RepID=A0A081C9L5_VECG1|nr:hypothetical protein U27_01170 [Candidatus Vecturithrix granuli]
MTAQTLKLDDIKYRSIEELLQFVSINKQILNIQLPWGEEVMIQPKTRLLPLPILDGYIPQGWKDAIYDESV